MHECVFTTSAEVIYIYVCVSIPSGLISPSGKGTNFGGARLALTTPDTYTQEASTI